MNATEVTALLAEHERAAWSIARRVLKRYHGMSADEDDIVSVVRMSFVRSARTFDASKGFGFLTYAWRHAFHKAARYAAKVARRGLSGKDDGSVPRVHTGFDCRKVDVIDPRSEDTQDRDIWETVECELPTGAARDVLAVYRDGLTQTEWAAEVGISGPSMSRRIKSSLEILRTNRGVA